MNLFSRIAIKEPGLAGLTFRVKRKTVRHDLVV